MSAAHYTHSFAKSETDNTSTINMEVSVDATNYIALSELNDSATQLSFRPSYDILWDQLTSEAMVAFKKAEQEGQAGVLMPLWRLVQHLREELCVVRKAANHTLNFVTDMKAHEDMVRRQKMEKSRQRAEKQMLKRLAQAEQEQQQPVPDFTQIE
jgi:hypothetical protein